jgi:hypothetical protein
MNSLEIGRTDFMFSGILVRAALKTAVQRRNHDLFPKSLIKECVSSRDVTSMDPGFFFHRVTNEQWAE